MAASPRTLTRRRHRRVRHGRRLRHGVGGVMRVARPRRARARRGPCPQRAARRPGDCGACLLLPRQSARHRHGQRRGADHRARHDAGRADRRSGRVGRRHVCRLRGGGRHAGARRRSACRRRSSPRLLAGAVIGLVNGALVGAMGLPSIVVTLAMLAILRDGLRWVTEGAWVRDLPSAFQWFGLGQVTGRSLDHRASRVILIGAGRLGLAPPRRRARGLCHRQRSRVGASHRPGAAAW